MVLTAGPEPTCHHRSSTGSGRTASTPSWSGRGCLSPWSDQSSGHHPSSRWRDPRVQRLHRCSCFGSPAADAPTLQRLIPASEQKRSAERHSEIRGKADSRGDRTLSRALVRSCIIWVRNRWGNMCHKNDHYPNSSEERVMIAELDYISRVSQWNPNQITLFSIYSQIDHKYRQT